MDGTPCDHKDQIRSAGNSIFMSDSDMLIVTTLFCQGCGMVFNKAGQIPVPKPTPQTKITIPQVKLDGKN